MAFCYFYTTATKRPKRVFWELSCPVVMFCDIKKSKNILPDDSPRIVTAWKIFIIWIFFSFFRRPDSKFNNTLAQLFFLVVLGVLCVQYCVFLQLGYETDSLFYALNREHARAVRVDYLVVELDGAQVTFQKRAQVSVCSFTWSTDLPPWLIPNVSRGAFRFFVSAFIIICTTDNFFLHIR